MQLRLAAAVAGLILLVLFTFVWRPPQATPDAALAADVVEDAVPELIVAPPPEDLAAPGTIRRTDRLVQPAGGSTLGPVVETPPPLPVVPVPQAGSATKPRPAPKPARVPAVKPARPAEAGSVAVPRRPPAVLPQPVPRPVVPEAGSVARRIQRLPAMPPTVVLGAAVGRSSTPGASAVMLAKFIAASPDGQQIAVGDVSGEIRLIDVASRSVIRRLKIDSGALVDILYTPDGALLASATGHQLMLFDPASGEIVRRYKTGDTWTAFALVSGGEHIIATSMTGRVVRISLTTGDVATIGEHVRPVSALTVSPDGRYAATGAADGSLRIWSLDTPGAPPFATETTTLGFQSLAFAPDSRTLAGVGSSASFRMWSLGPQGLTPEKSVKTLQSTTSLHFGRDPRHVYVTSQSAISHIYHIDTQTGAITALTDGNPPPAVRDMAMSSDGLTIATLFRDRTVHVVTLDPATSKPQKQATITAARDP